MERSALRAVRAAAAGVTRPLEQQGAQGIFFLSAGKGRRRDPHPGLDSDVSQQSSLASFQEGGQSRFLLPGNEDSQEEFLGSALSL